MSERITVVLVDDDALVRTGLALILGGDPEIAVVGEAPDGQAAVALVRDLSPDVVLMDIRMPVLDGIAATRMLLADGQEGVPRVIVLTTFDTDEMVVEALRAGASGFLLKSTRPERLVGAIRAVAVGEPMLSPTVTTQLISRVTAAPADDGDADRRRAARERLTALTDRELEVARAIGRGRSNADIARELYMGLPTVKAHVSHVLTKLGSDNRTQIALLVHDAQLGDPR